MAFRSNTPITLQFPAFRGTTRRILLLAGGAWAAQLVVGLVAPAAEAHLVALLMLTPVALLHGMVWQLVSYPFVGNGLLGLLFAGLSLWYFGSALEDERGPRWFAEFFLVSTIGGGLLASLIALAAGDRVRGLTPLAPTASLWPAVLATLLGFAYFHADQELRFNFIFRLKAKWLAAGYVGVYLFLALVGHDKLGALTALTNALCAYAFLRLAPRKSLALAASEWWFAQRNARILRKRRQAAKKFTVYMKKQGKEVSLDDDGRYIDPTGRSPKNESRDPNDRKWMN